jgi:hypothetical protein
MVGLLTGRGKRSRQSWALCVPKGNEIESEAEIVGGQASRNVHGWREPR